jgi:hypothetical protein
VAVRAELHGDHAAGLVGDLVDDVSAVDHERPPDAQAEHARQGHGEHADAELAQQPGGEVVPDQQRRG